jgi:hypothetical protein
LFDRYKTKPTQFKLPRVNPVGGRWPAWLLAALTLALVFYGINALHFAKQPLRIEEGEWPPMARAIFETGKPIIEADRTHRLRLEEDLSVDESPRIGAWHPPLYLYTLAASMTVLGTDSPYRLRLVGVAGLLISIGLLFLIAREVTRRWRLVGGIAALLALIHPLAIQDSVFLDIDPSIYAPLALLVVWLAIRYGKSAEPLRLSQILAIGAAIALITWTKMTTTIDVLAVLVFWWLLTRRPVRLAILEAISFITVGLGLFFATYGLWCALTDIPFSYTFDVTFIEKSDRLFPTQSYVEHALHWHLRWFGAAVVILGFVYLVDLIRSFTSEWRLRSMDLPFLIGAAILVQYVFLSPTDGTYQGKYAFPALLMLLLPISWMLLRKSATSRPVGQWAVAAAIGALAVLLIPDVLTGLAFLNVNYGSWIFELRLLAGVGAALLLAWWLGGQRGFPGAVILVTAALLAGQAIDSYRADTSPMYPIQDKADFNAAVNDLHRNLRDGDITIAVKDLGYYVDGPVIDGEEVFVQGDERLVRIIRKDPRIVAFARDSFGPPVGPATAALLSECFTDQHIFGTASVVYRSKRCN